MPTPIPVEVDFDIPFTNSTDPGYLARAQAVVGTTELLEQHGNYVPPGDVHPQKTVAEMAYYLANPGKNAVYHQEMSPAVARVVTEVLGQYNYNMLRHADSIRNLVVTKLLEEVENPRNKMQALQMLGKIPEVGLFVEKVVAPEGPNNAQEVTERLRQKLQGYLTKNTVSAPVSEVRSTRVAAELNEIGKVFSDD